MKSILTILFFSMSLPMMAQLENLKLSNAVVIGQMDNPEERYALEGAMASLLSDNGVSATPSLNYIKAGGDAREMWHVIEHFLANLERFTQEQPLRNQVI